MSTVVDRHLPPWTRVALLALLVATAALYLWGLSSNGYGNTFYAAAAEAGAHSWSAWFFGALDANDFITVDKPPASLWIIGLSVRLFGMNSWSVLVPQALMGVAAVATLYATVRRTVPETRHGSAAGLLAGAVLAATPAAALMFRFDNPDALLVLLLTAAAYCLVRAVESGSWRWLAAVGAVMGTAFLTKMLQGFLVLPGFALTYLLFAPVRWTARLRHLAIGIGALVVSAGWWVLAVQLVPARARPYIGGSTDNTVLDLAFGYNGISRIVGRHRETSWRTKAGLYRLFTGEMGTEISWLLPAAGVAVAFGGYLAFRHRLSRTERAALTMWLGWLVVTAAVLSYMDGTVHPYYTVALAPAIAALIGTGAVWAWQARAGWDGRVALAAIVLAAGGWSVVLLHTNRFESHVLVWPIVVVTFAAALAALVSRAAIPRSLAVLSVALMTVACLAGAVAYTFATVATPHRGMIPSALRQAVVAGGWMNDEATNAQVARLLVSTSTPWSAATSGSQAASALEVASGTAVMAVGGWSGDPVPTLQQFTDDVRRHEITYYVEPGRAVPLHGEVIRGANHSATHTREIADWVAQHYPPTIVGRSTVYRLT